MSSYLAFRYIERKDADFFPRLKHLTVKLPKKEECVKIKDENDIDVELKRIFKKAEVNPIGDWSGGTNVDTGAVNRKLGSDMGDSVTGGGLHGKDCTKADVSVNIYAFLKAQKTKKVVELSCAIGDELIDGKPYGEIVCIAKDFIAKLGGFEKFAEWGLF